MDARTAVAVSMLPVSRLQAAAVFKEVLSRAGTRSPTEILEWVLASVRGPVEHGRKVSATALESAQAAMNAGAAMGLAVIPLTDARYPPLLASTPSPPPVLWTRGDVDLLHQPMVAIVGSRAATSYALQVAEHLGSDLSARGVAVASGLARGVDSAAHRGALRGSAGTVAVLGCGLDRIYPAENAQLASDIGSHGALVSELGPGAPPLPEHFPLRNRIISGISLGVVVVEASEQSGSLITARCALEQGRDVMAVPGSVLTGRNRGSHALLKDGAKVVETADDILEGLGWPGATGSASGKQPVRDPLLDRMEPGEVYRLDELTVLTGIPGPKLLARLTELELLGWVSAAGMGRFGRVVT